MNNTQQKALTDEEIEDLRGEANRGFNIERDDYFKAFRDAEFAHGIVSTRPSSAGDSTAPMQPDQGMAEAVKDWDYQHTGLEGAPMQPSNEQLRAAFTKDTGGPNPFYRCKACGQTVPGLSETLAEHWLTHNHPTPTQAPVQPSDSIWGTCVPLPLIAALNEVTGGNKWQGNATAKELLEPAIKAIRTLAAPTEQLAVTTQAACKSCGRRDDPQGISTETGICFNCTYGGALAAALASQPVTLTPSTQAGNVSKERQSGDMTDAAFEKWLRTVCFQKPTPEAYDLARDAWLAARQDRKGEK